MPSRFSVAESMWRVIQGVYTNVHNILKVLFLCPPKCLRNFINLKSVSDICISSSKDFPDDLKFLHLKEFYCFIVTSDMSSIFLISHLTFDLENILGRVSLLKTQLQRNSVWISCFPWIVKKYLLVENRVTGCFTVRHRCPRCNGQALVLNRPNSLLDLRPKKWPRSDLSVQSKPPKGSEKKKLMCPDIQKNSPEQTSIQNGFLTSLPT